MKNYISIRDFTEQRHIRPETIVKIEGMSNYSRIVFENGRTLIVAKTLRKFSENLPPHFVRIHKSCLLNVHFVFRIDNLETIVLTNGSEVKIARRRLRLLRQNIVDGLFGAAA